MKSITKNNTIKEFVSKFPNEKHAKVIKYLTLIGLQSLVKDCGTTKAWSLPELKSRSRLAANKLKKSRPPAATTVTQESRPTEILTDEISIIKGEIQKLNRKVEASIKHYENHQTPAHHDVQTPQVPPPPTTSTVIESEKEENNHGVINRVYLSPAANNNRKYSLTPKVLSLSLNDLHA